MGYSKKDINSLVAGMGSNFIRYGKVDLRHDALAGLTVAVMGVPQAMAYALIAGLPPVYGLYTSIVTCIVAAVSGSSNHLVTGPTNALCMVILSLTAHLPEKYGIGLLETHADFGLGGRRRNIGKVAVTIRPGATCHEPSLE